MQYRIFINDKDYTTYDIIDKDTQEAVDISLDPLALKLLNNDIFELNDNKVKLIHSIVQQTEYIPGILILENQKTYGKKKDKFLYKCIPNDKHLPIFLIPYEIKNIGFSKNFTNIYVLFKFINWNGKHPEGILTNNIGSVDHLPNFYEYQLFCKNLNVSLKEFTKNVKERLKKLPSEELIQNIKRNHKIENREDVNVFTIDPKSTQDFDDAFSIKKIEDKTIISIYISNVTLWIEHMNLWSSFTNRITTIYLPDKKRPMLPTLLSDCLCSLKEDEIRFAFTLDITIEEEKITHHEFKNTSIKVKKNYEYEEDLLLKNTDYKLLFETCKTLNKIQKYTYNIRDSHDAVAYLMILINYYSSKNMFSYKNGIYRSVTVSSQDVVTENVSEEFSEFLKFWKNTTGQYVQFDNYIKHDILSFESYIHISSPIRRLIDLLNMIQFQWNNNISNFGKESLEFYNYWCKKLDYINVTSRTVRKIQNNCNILHLCSKDESILKKTHEGYLFDEVLRSDKLYQYMVYIPEIKFISKINSHERYKQNSSHQFKILVFTREDSFKKKIKVSIC